MPALLRLAHRPGGYQGFPKARGQRHQVSTSEGHTLVACRGAGHTPVDDKVSHGEGGSDG
jgi:hypothetical protein